MANKQFNSVDGYAVGNSGSTFNVIDATGNITASGSITRNSRNVPTFVHQADTPPSNPLVGDQWYNTTTGVLFEYLNDGTTSQWVDINGLPGVVGPIVLPGGTANAVVYLNSSGETVSSSSFVFDGSNVGIGTATPNQTLDVDGNIKWSGATYENIFAILDGASVDLDPANGTIQTWTLGASRSPTATGFANGQSMTLLIDDGTDYTITWPSVTWKTDGGIAPTLETTGVTVIVLWKVGNVLYGARVGDA
jgi:hypothetical protein